MRILCLTFVFCRFQRRPPIRIEDLRFYTEIYEIRKYEATKEARENPYNILVGTVHTLICVAF